MSVVVLSMATAQVLGVAGFKEGVYELLQKFIVESCTVDQLIMQLDLLDTNIWSKYQTDQASRGDR